MKKIRSELFQVCFVFKVFEMSAKINEKNIGERFSMVKKQHQKPKMAI